MIYKKILVLLIIPALMLSACSALNPAPSQTSQPATDVPATAAPPASNAALPSPTFAAGVASPEVATPESAQPVAGNGDAACLVGTWSIADFDSFVRALLPAGAFDANTLQYDNTEGRILYTFSKDGKVTVKAQHYNTIFKVKVDPADMVLAVTMDGTTSGTYSVNGNRVSIDKITDDQMAFAAVLDGTTMLSTTKLADVGPLFVPPNNYADFNCSGDKLSLVIPNLPASVSAITFKRLGK